MLVLVLTWFTLVLRRFPLRIGKRRKLHLVRRLFMMGPWLLLFVVSVLRLLNVIMLLNRNNRVDGIDGGKYVIGKNVVMNIN